MKKPSPVFGRLRGGYTLRQHQLYGEVVWLSTRLSIFNVLSTEQLLPSQKRWKTQRFHVKDWGLSPLMLDDKNWPSSLQKERLRSPDMITYSRSLTIHMKKEAKSKRNGGNQCAEHVVISNQRYLIWPDCWMEKNRNFMLICFASRIVVIGLLDMAYLDHLWSASMSVH